MTDRVGTAPGDKSRTSTANNVVSPDSGMSEGGLDVVRDWLDSKPEKLKAILNKIQSQTEDSQGMHGQKLSTGNLMTEAELRYQAVLGRDAERILALYQHLSVDDRVELLAQAEAISERTAHERQRARQEMSHRHAHEVHAQVDISAPPSTYTLSRLQVSPPVTAATQSEPRPAAITIAPSDPKPVDARPVLTSVPDLSGQKKVADEPSLSALTPEQSVGKQIVERVSIGNPLAFTVNLPFTTIPGLPAVTGVLRRIDRATNFDLGFTFKGVAEREQNPDGSQDQLYRLSYVGAGVMSNKFNMQLSPFAVKISNTPDYEGWGGNSSVITKRHSDVIGTKYTINFGEKYSGVSYAPEMSYQPPSNRTVSTLTGGMYLGDDAPVIRIPARYVSVVNDVIDSLPTREETAMILDRVDRVIPINQAVKLGEQVFNRVAGVSDPGPSDTGEKKPPMQQALEGLTPDQQAVVMARINENMARSSDPVAQDPLALAYESPSR